MVLKLLEALFNSYFPITYAVHIFIGLITVYAVRTFSQGKRTNRERNLHARTVLVTGGFTPLGVTILQSLAERGAHIIALTPEPIESPKVSILIDLLRSTTSNEQIYAEECDLSSPASVHFFCTKFLTGTEHRLDAIIFAHENKNIGSPARLSTTTVSQDQKERDSNALATFLIITLLLPKLLVAPAERDIRIINVVNPFYAAAVGRPFSPSFSFGSSSSLLLREGHRALRSIILTRHLQRVLDALPHSSPVPKAEGGSSTVPVLSPKIQKSNIVAVSVSPGISRVDTISPLLNADWNSPSGPSYLGTVLYILLQPLLRILTKSPGAAMQTVLHVLFLPTPFKILASVTGAKNSKTPVDTTTLDFPEEVLRPGALYADCAIVKPKISIPPELVEDDKKLREDDNQKAKKDIGSEGKEKVSLHEEVLDIEDDGEYGGELAGRLVWESFERALKDWEKETPPTERDRDRERTDKEEKAKAPKPSQSPKEKVYY